MATIDRYIPILLLWEASTIVKSGETLEQTFERARVKGFSNDPKDTGGATMIGVTMGTYRTYCKHNSISMPTVNDLKNIPYKVWRDIVHTLYWNKVKADLIEDQQVANMIVDWVWHSGAGMIKKIQGLVKATLDGIIGPKTIAAVNSTPDMLKKLYSARKAYFEAIVKRNPSQKKWLNGWMNRLNDLMR